MALLVANAAGLWRQIPDELLPEVVEEGIALAGGFEANAGHVTKAWANRTATKALELGGRRYGTEALKEAAEWEAHWNSLSPEEKQDEQRQHAEFFRGLRAKLGAA